MRLGKIFSKLFEFSKLFDRWVETSQISSQNQAPNHISTTVPNIPSPPPTPNSSVGIALAQNSLRISEDFAREILNNPNPTGEVRRRSDGQDIRAHFDNPLFYNSLREREAYNRAHFDNPLFYNSLREREAYNRLASIRGNYYGSYDEARHNELLRQTGAPIASSSQVIESLRNEIKRLNDCAKTSFAENLALKEIISQQEKEIAILRSRVRGEVHGIKDLDIGGEIV